MKLIEAMKSIKRIQNRIEAKNSKIREHAARLENEEEHYTREDVQRMVQSNIDSIAEIARARLAITATNLATSVTIKIGDEHVTKPIAYWILRRRELADLERSVIGSLNDRNLQPVAYKIENKEGPDEVGVHNVVRNFSIKGRDERMSALSEEPALIDAALEIANATTDLVEVTL